MTLDQFRAIQLPPTLQQLGQWGGGAGVLYWFWWVLIEKGALASLTGGPKLMEILLGLPLILILPAIFYTTVFLLLRVVVWMQLPEEIPELDFELDEAEKKPMSHDDSSAS